MCDNPIVKIILMATIIFVLFCLTTLVISNLYEVDDIRYMRIAEFDSKEPKIRPLIKEALEDGKITKWESTRIYKEYRKIIDEREKNKEKNNLIKVMKDYSSNSNFDKFRSK